MLSSLKSLVIRVKVVALQYETPPSLFTMLRSAGHFILLWQVTQRPTHRQVVALLQSRGLYVEDVERSENYLRRIGYYRFSAYLYPLLSTPKENHVFKSGNTFNQALDMYRFDRHLRLLMFNDIEMIEIAVRSAIVNITSRETCNPFWDDRPIMFL